ncbi:MAG TPA: hypothetical protein VJU61_13680 [Polyangiaceae bacterium]|nr:hypothetical protein [Polyangiaceae bacterium]
MHWIETLGRGCLLLGLLCLAPSSCAIDSRSPDVGAVGGTSGASGASGTSGTSGTSGASAGSSGSAGSTGGSSADPGPGLGGSTAHTDCSNENDAGCSCLADGGRSCPTDAGCSGCSIEGDCVAAGVTAAEQPCLICDPARSTTAWSNNDGVSCEDGQFCTVEDICQDGVCLAGQPRICPADEACSNDACVPVPQPFTCDDTAPAAPFPVAVRDTGTAPEPEGGTIVEGTYTMTRVRLFGDFTSVRGEGLVLRGNYVHRNSTTYLASSGAALTGVRQLGTFTTTGTALAVDTENCGIAGSSPSIWGYTASATQLELFKQDFGFLTVETYLRQP